MPAETTATVPRGSGNGPSVTARATASMSASGSDVATWASASSESRVASTARSGCFSWRVRRIAMTWPGRLAGAVDDLGVAGPPRAVDVDAREPEVLGARVVVHRSRLSAGDFAERIEMTLIRIAAPRGQPEPRTGSDADVAF